MSENEQRRTARKYADYVVEFYEPDGLLLAGVGRLLDLSPTGARVESSLRFTPGQALLVRLRRGNGSDVDLSATVVRRQQRGTAATYGIRFKRD
jgi:hypothetical protein